MTVAAGRLREIVDRLARELEAGEGVTRRPSSTYRLQLLPGFGFAEAAAAVPYLQALGVEAVYLSPILQAAPGSTHGYDVVDHSRLSQDLGGEAGYDSLCRALAAEGLGQIVDLVPNHMGVGSFNAWWMDVLENGPSSLYADHFDIDWHPLKGELENKVLVPVLGDQYGVVLERGELAIERDGGAFFLRHFAHRFPLAPRSVPVLLRHGIDRLRDELGAGDVHLQELESICTALDKLAPREEPDPDKMAERAREKEVAKRRLGALCAASPAVRAHVDRAVAAFNGTPREPRSFDLLHGLLEFQAYRLAYWRVAGDEINYRRFFDVNSLAALRMEEPKVFAAAHALLLRLVAEGKVTGLRIDHPDGLYDPTGYFRGLQSAYLAERGRALAARDREEIDAEAVAALTGRIESEIEAGRLPARPLYVVVEKILMGAERMPETWAVDGTTGYEFLTALNGLFVDGASARAFDALTTRFRGGRADFREEAYEKKVLVSTRLMSSEIRLLASRLDRASETDRRTRDFTLGELTRALVEYASLLPVYRTYVSPRGEVDARDRGYVESTVARARRRAHLLDPSVLDFVRDVLLQRYPAHLPASERREWLEFTLRLQQITGAITAKALEDTAFYTYARLLSLNEVGGDPAQFGTAPEAFHAQNQARLSRWPGSLLATTTHDTKRSEDARLRIDALSEVPADWWERLRAWARLTRRFASSVQGGRAPDRNEEMLVYQTLVATLPDEAGPAEPGWPDYLARILAYVEKALREAKVHTSWTRVDAEYEAAVRRFVESALSSEAFVADLAPFARRVAAAARLSSLAQLALKLASPGVCDVYQGTELWDLSLVDPDNRRPVDYELRARMLEELDRRQAEGPAARVALAREVSSPDGLRDGRAKMLLLASGLRLRRREPALFLGGQYLPLAAEGADASRAVAFARAHGGRALLCVAPRLALSRLGPGGEGTWGARLRIPEGLPGAWEDVVTGEAREGRELALGPLFSSFPVALLRSR